MKNKARRASPSYPIGSVDNALKLLLLFRTRPALRVSEAADALAVARSTAHRLLAMLEFHGFVAQDPATRLYVAGPALTDVGLAIVRDMDIRTVAHPTMVVLAQEVGETVHLITLRDAEVLFVDSVESSSLLRVGSRTGMTLPAHATAGGKALLAALPQERLRRLYPRERLEGLTGRTITSRAKLLRELEGIRQRGYAVNLGESETGVGAVASAITDRSQRLRGALAVAAPQARLNEARARRIGAAAVRACKEIGERLA